MKFDIEKGQVWEYQTRPGEEDSCLVIVDCEQIETGSLFVHIMIEGLKVKDNQTGEIKDWSISHTPIDGEMLIKSLKRIVSYRKIEVNEGLLYWREEFKKGVAGVWSIDLAEVITLTENSIYNQNN